MNLSQGVPWTISCQVKPQRFVWEKSFVFVLGFVLSPPRLPLVHSALSGVVFCVDFDPFFPSSGVLSPGVFPTSLKHFNPQNWDWKLCLKKRQNPTKTGRSKCRCWFSWASRGPGIIRHCPLDLTLVAAGNWSKDLGLSTSSTLLQQKLIRRKECAFCTFGCGLLFRLWSFCFSSLVPLPGVFLLFISYKECLPGVEDLLIRSKECIPGVNDFTGPYPISASARKMLDCW